MINILPYEQKRAVKRIRIMRIVTVVLWMTVILLVIAGVLFLPTLMTINSRYQIALAQVARLEATGVIVKPVDVESLTRRARTLEEKLAVQTPADPFDYVTHIREIAKGGISLVGFTIPDTTALAVEVVGVASTRASLQNFITALEADPMVDVVDSPITNFVKGTESDFTIKVTFKKSS